MIAAGRMLTKRLLRATLGEGATRYAHALYHAVLRRIGAFGVPETAATQRLLAALAGQAGTIIDVGVNIGRFSWFLARHRRPGVPLYGFEPNAEAYALALRNLAGLSAVTLLPIGLAENDQTATLAVPQDATGTPVSGLGYILDGPPPADHRATQAVTLKRLDGLIAAGTIRLAPPVLLKIDIEGYEPPALAGMAELLTQHRPWIFFECEPAHLRRAGYDWPDVFEPLQRLGYVILADQDGVFISVTEPIQGVVNYFALMPDQIPPLASFASFANR